ncbi:hypothetical protein G9A89_020611 [Geosiphon pyriformis]|nr:hypothetical protein G9A89_020611 [Geosiphon pyriformis]
MFSNFAPCTTLFALVIFLLSTLGAVLRYRQWLEDPAASTNPLVFLITVPGFAGKHLWTFLTAPFMETNLTTFLGSMVVMLVFGTRLERVWGSREFLKFVAIVAVGSNLAGCSVYLIEYALTKNTFYLYESKLNGMVGLAMGFLIGLMQLDPEMMIQPFPINLSVRIKNLPGALLGLSNLYFVVFEAQSQKSLIEFSWMISWIYLRFFRIYANGRRGDQSEGFSFSVFFPEFIRPVINKISSIVFNIFVSIGFCKPASRKNFSNDTSNEDSELSLLPLPGSRSADDISMAETGNFRNHVEVGKDSPQLVHDPVTENNTNVTISTAKDYRR